MSPIAVEPDFTRRYIEHSNNEHLVKHIQNSFDRAAWEKDFIIIEGTGHAGVGSVFDLSNARVAKLLESKVILVTRGGIGQPIDEIALNKALFDQEGVEVVGVILNKVLKDKFEYVRDFARRGFARLGIELLGVIPEEPLLANATLGQICKTIKGEFVHGKNRSRRRVQKIIIGAANSANVMEHFRQCTLIITPGDREDVIHAMLSAGGQEVAGLILAGSTAPNPRVIEMLATADIPAIASPLESYAVASGIHSMTVKTLPGDVEKIDKIQALIEGHVDIDRLMEKLAAPPA